MITKLKEVDDFFSSFCYYSRMFDFSDLEEIATDIWITRMNIFGLYL